MGSVYHAVNDSIGRRVAIKLLDPRLANQSEFMRRFQMEARAAAVIGHPGIVDVLDMGQTDEGAPFIVMEYLEGATLSAHLRQHGPLTPAGVAAVVAPVLDALSAAHAAGVIHRDLKPGNIFLVSRPHPTVKILDFGISKFDGPQGGSVTTNTGTTLGTPSYMSPEQVRGSRQLNSTTDLYAVGALLYKMLSGRPPFEADSDFALVARVLTEEHLSLVKACPEVPLALALLVDSLLEKAPEDRPRDALAVKKTLLAAVTPDPEAVWQHADSWVRITTLEVTPIGKGPGEDPDAKATVPSGPSAKSSDVTRTEAPGRPQTRTLTPVAAGLSTGKKVALGLATGAAVVLVGGLGIGAYVWTRPEPEVVVAPPPPAVKAKVVLTLRGEPASAQWSVGGKALAGNPCEYAGEQGQRITAKVSAPGHLPRELELLLDETREVSAALEPLAAAQVVPLPVDPQPVKTTGKKPRVPGKPLSIDENNPYK
jgi:serine/threonine-protein kinase